MNLYQTKIFLNNFLEKNNNWEINLTNIILEYIYCNNCKKIWNYNCKIKYFICDCLIQCDICFFYENIDNLFIIKKKKINKYFYYIIIFLYHLFYYHITKILLIYLLLKKKK